jgi:hypothetical protein
MLAFLKDDPEGKYLEQLDDTTLPRLSDAVLVMVQFETALASFKATTDMLEAIIIGSQKSC